MSKKDPVIHLDDISIRLYNRIVFSHTSWKIHKHENWAVLGANGSGKTTLVKALTGKIPVIKGRVHRYNPLALKENIGYISFEAHREYLEKERLKDDERYFSGKIDDIETVASFICKDIVNINKKDLQRLISLFRLHPLLKRSIPALSTGEMRKVVIVKELMKKPSLLILDEPFDGLDKKSRKRLSRHIRMLSRLNVQIILVTHRHEEIVKEITHILIVDHCRVLKQGKRGVLLRAALIDNNLSFFYGAEKSRKNGPDAEGIGLPSFYSGNKEYEYKELIHMNNVFITYGEVIVFKSLSWTMMRGENWLITGPNGSGKSTLLSLVTGDNPQAYKSEIYLFGRRRGTGESIWDIKKKIGFVSSQFHLNYYKTAPVLHVLLSGFFDSTGLYRRPSDEQTEIARAWLKTINLLHKEGSMFQHLSFGEQRMVLLARSMVKSPLLLILDEPCQGLDRNNRELILDLADKIGKHSDTDVIFVTHYSKEAPRCITNSLVLPV
ncbi:MAG: ATP-binding cassette domain-containing protein [Spirochaetales bacterium]|nr:ATP-binding cassette domain-containing protein [Spirochaetales bacterium]